MHIALTLQRIRKGDGTGRVNYEIVKELLRQRHRVSLIASEIPPEFQTHPLVVWHRVPWSKRFTTLIGNLWFGLQTTKVLRKLHAQFDIVKQNGFTSFYPADIIAVHTIHEVWLRSPTYQPAGASTSSLRTLYRRLYMKCSARLERRAFHQARVLVAVSNKVKEELQAYLGLAPEKIRTIHNGVDLQEFSPGQEDRIALGLPPNKPLGLFVGDIRTYGKNLDTVLAALAQVPQLHLAVAGDTHNSPFPAFAEKLGVAERVHFLGFRRDIPKLMRAADLFIFPSRYEACSLALLEAMASGLPIVTAQTAGGCELITPESGVVLPDPNDVSALAETLCALLAEPERLKAMGRAGRAIAERHSWEIMADQYVALFEELHPS
ncbi:MAG TPA: glycosyltransferase family 4 protein [Chthonomonas sp.]|uniref:glycosyltransferase family 4 protein n=1 Tax=Chthonomonas sp. TaxID=2282153 RepID=UPI002B4B671E|nr:glycosyltransferase family 4 protein [Chthonomonas sp.]HLH78927.1 glycosyltransferase family 4 protein [Chthonomonas sp.]